MQHKLGLAYLCLALVLAPACADRKFQNQETGPLDARIDGPDYLWPDLPIGWEPAPPKPKYLIYAHTDTKLFKADPNVKPLKLVEIGDFDCVGPQSGRDSGKSGRDAGKSGRDVAMTDIAVDKDGKLFGVSQTGVYPLEINGALVHCVEKWQLPAGAFFYGLTFAPAGVLQAQEMLVAANSAGELWAVDKTGKTTQVGSFGKVPANDGHGHTYQNADTDWELSGDIVFMANEGKPLGFATVRDCPNPPSTYKCNSTDTLIEINVPALQLNNVSSVTKAVRGLVVKSAGCTDTSTQVGYGSMYGIAAWDDKVYGFSRGGDFVEISNVDGTACKVTTETDTSQLQFAGAGITTVVPIKGPS